MRNPTLRPKRGKIIASFSLYDARRTTKTIPPGYVKYTQLKNEWNAAHPNATTQERNVALDRISKGLGK